MFCYNSIACLCVNLAKRNITPPGITVDLQNLEFFDALDTLAFIFSNFVLLHDFKWLMFLNGPIFLISSYLLVLAEVENQ